MLLGDAGHLVFGIEKTKRKNKKIAQNIHKGNKNGGLMIEKGKL